MAATIMAGGLSTLQLLAIVGIIVVALGLMADMVKPSDALKHLCAILGTVTILTLLLEILMGAWSDLLPWQKLGLITLVIALWFCRRPKPRNRNDRSR
jgi:hypothetical protein